MFLTIGVILKENEDVMEYAMKAMKNVSLDQTKRFDMSIKPKKEAFYLTPLAYALSFPSVWYRKLKINKVDMKGLKPPYVLLCTHHAFIDFKVTTKAIFPHRANYIVAIDGFIKREWLLRHVGAICKRKFTNDPMLFRHIRYALNELKQIVAIYPEARYSLIGKTAILPDSLAKMVKVLKKPVVVLNMHGNHLTQPVWNLKMRYVPLEADMTQILSAEDVDRLDVDRIKKKIEHAFEYDEYRYQAEKHIRIKESFRAEGLHRVLYQCPNCKKEHVMATKGTEIRCQACKKSWNMLENGRLQATEGKTEFPHIPDWFDFQAKSVDEEVRKGNYRFEDHVLIEALPNAKGYVDLGKGYLVHDENGFKLTGMKDGKPFELIKEPLSMYGLHIELDYFGKGDCIDLSTLDDTFYIYPINKKDVVTKMHFATESLYRLNKERLEREKA